MTRNGWAWLNLVTVIVTIAVNVAANALPINGQATGEISDRFDLFFTPAGYVFSIWGLIYIALIAFVVYQLLAGGRSSKATERIGPWLVISGIANITWILLWHYNQFTLSIAAMLLLLVSLVTIYLRLDIGRWPVSRVHQWLIEIPFTIYLGWITVATIANAAIVLDVVNWNQWGISGQLWTVIMLAVGLVVAYLVARTRRDVAYLLVLVWAFIGVGVQNLDVALVLIAALVAAAGVAALTFLAATSWRPLPSRLSGQL